MPDTIGDSCLWEALRNSLVSTFPRDVFETWFAGLTQTACTDGTLVLEAPNQFAAIWIEDNYAGLIAERAGELTGEVIEIKIVAGDREEQAPSRLPKGSSSEPGAPADAGQRSQSPAKRSEPIPEKDDSARSLARRKAFLNPKNTFENFIVGPSNQLAHAAAMAVANVPAKSFNPLFLYGDTGLGKTHLMHAIAHTIQETKKTAQVAYVSCEKFTNEFIAAIQQNTLIEFRRYYRNIDVLLIDDIHFLAGKERIQEEFFHTFNELFESQRQICLSSDRPVGEIARLEARLVSRFQWGMVSDIQPPDLETRVAILAKKTSTMGSRIPNEVLEFLAKRITRNVRRMEGALTRVVSYASLTRKPLDIQVVERLLSDTLLEERSNEITVEKIQKAVVDYFGLKPSDMVSRRRTAKIAFGRQVAMYLSRLLTSKSLQDIGESFGGRDHGTVIHACRTVEAMIEQNDKAKQDLNYLENQLSRSN